MFIKKFFLALTLFTLVACAGQPQVTPTLISTPFQLPTNAPIKQTASPTTKDNIVILKINYEKPITFTVVNSQTGVEENNFSPPNIQRASRKFIWDNSFLYEKEDGSGVSQIGLDGKTITDYPFVSKGDAYCCLSLLQSHTSQRIAWAECKFEKSNDTICINTIYVALKNGQSKMGWEVSTRSGVGEVELLNWSADDRYIYFNHFTLMASSQLAGSGNDLWELDLTTGQTRNLWKDSFYYYVSISPQHSLIAYVVSPDQKQTRKLILQNPRTNQTREAIWSDRYSSPIWSYDGAHLLYVDHPRLLIFDVDKLISTPIHDNIGERYLYPLLWLPNNIIFLTDSNDQGRSLWRLSLSEKNLQKVFTASEWLFAETKP